MDIMVVVTLMIRVVNAFRHGVDSAQLQQAASNQNIQRVLQRQASLGNRSSLASSLTVSEEPTNKVSSLVSTGTAGTINCNTNSKPASSSHTETAV